MKLSSWSSRVERRGVGSVGAGAGGMAWHAAPAPAAHRARLSADLADHLAAGSQTIDVIVHGERAEIERSRRATTSEIRKTLKSGAVLRVNAGQLDAVRQDETVDHLSGDIRIKSSADVTAESIGADQVWAGSDDVPALTGAGVTVAVIDSGIDTRHNASCGDGSSRRRTSPAATASICSATARTWRGSSPGRPGGRRRRASIAASRRARTWSTCGCSATTVPGYASDVIEAIDWAIDHRKRIQDQGHQPVARRAGAAAVSRRSDVRGGGARGEGRASWSWRRRAITGRRRTAGRCIGAITSPANSPYALTVGALDTHGTPQRSDDTLATYSSKGPTRYDLVIKPDVAAPGSHIVSAESTGAYLSQTLSRAARGGERRERATCSCRARAWRRRL